MGEYKPGNLGFLVDPVGLNVCNYTIASYQPGSDDGILLRV